MTFLLLNLITVSRSVGCPIVWFWCWRRRPKRMVLWMVLAFAYFLVTDHYDGQWAREYGLASELGFWLDHLGDFCFYGVVVMSIILGPREASLERRRTRGGGGGGAAARSPGTVGAPVAAPSPTPANSSEPASSAPAAPSAPAAAPPDGAGPGPRPPS